MIKADYILTPAYDLICTSLHFPEEGRTALDLFDSHESEHSRQNAFYGRSDFLHLAEIYGMNMARAERMLDQFQSREDTASDLIRRSFLSETAKADFRTRLGDRLQAIRGLPAKLRERRRAM